MAENLNQRPGCLALFALPFALVGVAMAVWAGSDLVKWRRMSSWNPVECRILHAELESTRGSDSTTWKVSARYRYLVGGREYVGDRVAVTIGSDNIGDFHQRLFRRLDAHRRAGTPALCWVNPEDPRDAILHREMRWEMFLFKLAFVLAFGGVGLGLLIYALSGMRRARRGDDGAGTREAAEILSSTPRPGILLLMALVFLGLSAGVCLPLLEEVKAGNSLALLFVLFPLAGLGLLAAAIHGFLRRGRFGTSRLRILSGSVGPGENLRGEVRIPISLNEDFHLLLTARPGGKDDHSGSRPFWSREEVVRSTGYADFSTLNFSIPLPEKLEPPDLSGLPPAVLTVMRRMIKGPLPMEWRLEVRAELPGVDYRETFRLPPGAVKIHLYLPEDDMGTGDPQ